MRVITVYLDDSAYRGLCQEAAQSDCTPPEKASQIIAASVPPLLPGKSEPQTGKEFLAAIRAIVEPIGGIELELPQRAATRETPWFGYPEEWNYAKNDNS